MEYLKGEVYGEKFKDIEYENVTINFQKYIDFVKVGWRNGSTIDVSLIQALEIVQVEVTFTGFMYGEFVNCVGTVVNEAYKKDILYAVNYYKRDDVLDTLMVERGNVFLILHYPKQFLLSPLNIQEFKLNRNRTVNDIVYFTVHGVEILKRRNKLTDHCTSGFTDFDDIVLKNHIRGHGCKPPYITKYKDLPICSSQRKMKDARYKFSEKNNKNFRKSCNFMSKIDFTSTSDPNMLEETNFGIGIVHPEQMKIISQTQAVDFHSLVGNIGGYIGLFLGIEY